MKGFGPVPEKRGQKRGPKMGQKWGPKTPFLRGYPQVTFEKSFILGIKTAKTGQKRGSKMTPFLTILGQNGVQK